MSQIGPEDQLVVRCECGFETRGTADQIVPALQKHAGESHNMKGTRDQVLARAEPVCRPAPDRTQPWGVEGPVQAEVFVLRMKAGRPELAGPCGPDPWYIEVAAEDDPLEVVSRLTRNLMGEPVLVHSTSWRRARGAVVLSFVVVNSDNQAPQLLGVPIVRAELARSGATSAARTIAAAQVLEHGLRHLAWLAKEDETVMGLLSDDWKRMLVEYMPEPFRNIL